MAYLDNIFGKQAERLSEGMKLATHRQSMLVRNLANINTPGYKRDDMDFMVSLDEAMGADADEFNQAFKRGTARDNSKGSSIRSDGNNVDLEREVFEIAETEHRFNTLADMTARYFSGLKNVIRDGR